MPAMAMLSELLSHSFEVATRIAGGANRVNHSAAATWRNKSVVQSPPANAASANIPQISRTFQTTSREGNS